MFSVYCYGDSMETCLSVGSDAVDIKTAKKYCADNGGGSLVQFETKEELDFALAFARNSWKDEAGWNSKSVWTDMYRENEKVYLQGGELGFEQWKSGEPAGSESNFVISLKINENESDEGYVLDVPDTTAIPMCQTPAKERAEAFCSGDGDDEVCLTMGSTKVTKSAAVDYCVGEGGSLIQIDSEETYKLALHLAKSSSRLETGDYDSSGGFWTDMYHEKGNLHEKGSGVAMTFTDWKDGTPPTADVTDSTVSVSFSDDSSQSTGYDVSDPNLLFAPLCCTPAYPSIDEHCFDDSGSEVCLFIGRDALDHSGAASYCTDNSGKLVDVESSNMWEQVKTFARFHTLAVKNNWDDRYFWTNMYATDEDNILMSNSNAGFGDWAENDIKYNTNKRKLVVRVTKDGENQGYFNKRDNKSFFPMCRKN